MGAVANCDVELLLGSHKTLNLCGRQLACEGMCNAGFHTFISALANIPMHTRMLAGPKQIHVKQQRSSGLCCLSQNHVQVNQAEEKQLQQEDHYLDHPPKAKDPCMGRMLA